MSIKWKGPIYSGIAVGAVIGGLALNSNYESESKISELRSRLADLDWGSKFLDAGSASAREEVLDNFAHHHGGEVRGRNLENFYDLLTANCSLDLDADNNNNGLIDKTEIQTNLMGLGMTDRLSGWNSCIDSCYSNNK